MKPGTVVGSRGALGSSSQWAWSEMRATTTADSVGLARYLGVLLIWLLTGVCSVVAQVPCLAYAQERPTEYAARKQSAVAPPPVPASEAAPAPVEDEHWYRAGQFDALLAWLLSFVGVLAGVTLLILARRQP